MRSERGQIIVIFALALVAMIAMVGLILDGGAAFAHRRDEQTASDLAALAGAYAPIRDALLEISRWGLLIAIAALGLGTSMAAMARGLSPAIQW